MPSKKKLRKTIEGLIESVDSLYSEKIDLGIQLVRLSECKADPAPVAKKQVEPRTRKTLVVNMFAGPGCGKSTTAAGLFYRLKKSGVNCELVREYAKDRTWIGDYATLGYQPYVTAKQHFRQDTLDGKVDVIITDSPILIGLVYSGRGCTPSFKDWLLEAFSEFDNLNIVLGRNAEAHPYNPLGRSQTEAEANQKDVEIRDLLLDNQIPFSDVSVGDDDLDTVYTIVRERMARQSS
jgi:hypothetical protein